jgi:hypothetical protein
MMERDHTVYNQGRIFVGVDISDYGFGVVSKHQQPDAFKLLMKFRRLQSANKRIGKNIL